MSEILNVRLPKGKKSVLQSEAESRELTVSEHIRNIIESFEPFPPIVERTINTLSDKLKMDYKDIISAAVLSMIARWNVEISLFGEELLSSLRYDFRKDKWEFAIDFYSKLYRDKLYEDAASMRAHEKYLEDVRAQNLRTLKKLRAKKAAQEQAEKSEDQE